MHHNHRVNSDHSWKLLKEIILENTRPGSGSYPTAVKGFSFHRNTSNADPKPHFFQPVVIVVAQGKKLVRIGPEEHRYGERVCFVSGVDMPVTSCIMEASPEKPYLSMSLDINTGLITELAGSVPLAPGKSQVKGAVIQEVDPELLDAFLRLAELAGKPDQLEVMESLILREIHYRLLTSPFGKMLRSLNLHGSQVNQITRAVAWLKDHYKEAVHIEELAGKVNMAPSTFHRYFKDITTLSPLQYQKRLRLTEAQRLMLSEGYDVQSAANTVGYESDTQFTREYKKLYGDPPRRNIIAMKQAASGKVELKAVF